MWIRIATGLARTTAFGLAVVGMTSLQQACGNCGPLFEEIPLVDFEPPQLFLDRYGLTGALVSVQPETVIVYVDMEDASAVGVFDRVPEEE